jgi:hypothetical protein
MDAKRSLRLLAIAAIFLVCGCSNNKGKIEATKWSSLKGTVKGVEFPDNAFHLAFGGDGRLIYRVQFNGVEKTVTGKYTLGFGDLVTLDLDQDLAGQKKHMQSVVINGDRLTFTDPDGTTLNFVKK